jgi:GH25 family lysozyme M1 (1,4-beta-N-acetylmuramidase)
LEGGDGEMTTTYGWDTSHYDGTITPAIARRAVAEGIAFATHKIGEGLSNTDTTAAASLEAFRAAGVRVLGGYYFLHPGAMAAQARRCVTLADQHVPWWRTFGGWFWQADAETSSSGLPSPSEVKLFADTLANLTDRKVVVYASAGQYGNRLAGLRHPLWNARYGTNPHGQFKTIYPGNSSAGWNTYSGQTPLLLQYGSNATIAGRTTCDANAFRGTVDQLLAALGATPDPGEDMPITVADNHLIWHNAQLPAHGAGAPDVSSGQALIDTREQAYIAAAGVAGLTQQVAALTAAVTAMSQHGTAVETALILAEIERVGQQESTTVAALRAELSAANARLAAQAPPTAGS